jgi:hypothetical protein
MAQAGVLMWQYWRGPRCFVPRCFQPPKYDYHRPAPVAILLGGSQCDTPVCAPGQAADGSGGDAAMPQSLVLRSSSSSAFSRHGSSDSDKGESGTLACDCMWLVAGWSVLCGAAVCRTWLLQSSCTQSGTRCSADGGSSQQGSPRDAETGHAGLIECVICMSAVEVGSPWR